jgi:hypothetical protein
MPLVREGALRCASRNREADIWGLLASAPISAIFPSCCDWSAVSGLGACQRTRWVLRCMLGLWEKISLRLVHDAFGFVDVGPSPREPVRASR